MSRESLRSTTSQLSNILHCCTFSLDIIASMSRQRSRRVHPAIESNSFPMQGIPDESKPQQSLRPQQLSREEVGRTLSTRRRSKKIGTHSSHLDCFSNEKKSKLKSDVLVEEHQNPPQRRDPNMAFARISSGDESHSSLLQFSGAAALVSKASFAVAGSNFQMDDRQVLAYLESLTDDNDRVDFSVLKKMAKDKANFNGADEFGQTPMHDVARRWGVDVAKCLHDHGAELNTQDFLGRTPLHVAVSSDASDMVRYLINNGADPNLQTNGELQTPLHFAAKSDAVESTAVLLEANCQIEIKDYKGRTPLQISAELDRSESVKFLLEVQPRPADAGVRDSTGQTAISSMVQTMPPVARYALDQLHRKSGLKRKQLFYLNLLEKLPIANDETDSSSSSSAYSPLEMIVRYKYFDLVSHPVIRTLISIKWKQFGRTGAILQLVIFLTFLVALTVFTVAADYKEKHNYTPLRDHWWRILAAVVAVGILIYQWVEEIGDILRSRKQHKLWVQWRTSEYKRDLDYCHPKYQEEKEYVQQEMKNLEKSGSAYFDDKWNYIDWISYALLFAAIVAHIVDIAAHTNSRAAIHARLLCIALIFAWLRVLKVVRAFEVLGPFVVILQHMVADVVRFGFLYIIIYIPYAASFWVFFGGRSVPGFKSVSTALFSLYRITLVDEYAYNEMKAEDSIMADILVGTFLALAAVISLNLFIALMSDTFQRVYDNAKANAVMQRASILLSLEEKLTKKKLNAYRREIHSKCAPLEEFYDDDDQEGDELKKITTQTYDEVQNLKKLIANLEGKLEEREMEGSEKLRLLEHELKEIKTILRHLPTTKPQ